MFGIIKASLGFDRFRLRGLLHRRFEWTLVTRAYDLQWLYRRGVRLQPPATARPLRRPSLPAAAEKPNVAQRTQIFPS